MKSLCIIQKLNKAQTKTFKRKPYHPFHSSCKDSYFNKDELPWADTWPVEDYIINKFLVLHTFLKSLFNVESQQSFPDLTGHFSWFPLWRSGPATDTRQWHWYLGRVISTLVFSSDISSFHCCFTVLSVPITFPFSYGSMLLKRQPQKVSDFSLAWASLGTRWGSDVDSFWGTKERTPFSLANFSLHKFLIHCLLYFSL